MGVTSPGRRLRSGLSLLGICLLAFSAPGHRLKAAAEEDTGTFEKLIVASGVAALEVDLQRLGPGGAGATRTRPTVLRFDLERDSFLTVLVFNGELRGPLPGSVRLIPLDSAALPRSLASRDLLVEQTAWGAPFDLVVRDAATGLALFNVEGHEYAYESKERSLSIRGGRVLVSEEFAAELGRPAAAGSVVGTLSIDATMRPIEVTQIVDGEIRADSLPAVAGGASRGRMSSSGTSMAWRNSAPRAERRSASPWARTRATPASVDLNWFALPNNDHPVIPQNLYRMSGGPTNDERFEQIGQSNVKHAFTALTQNICGFGCNGVGGSRLGSGCSDPYSAGLNAGPNLGSRAWINPFTGFYPRGDSATPPNTHTGHAHLGPSHRILTEVNDLNTAMNPGATYYSEGQYVTPHEYAWCQAHPGECNMNNNVSYRRYNVIGTASPFSFSAGGRHGANPAGHQCLDRRDPQAVQAVRRNRWCRDRGLQGDESITRGLALRVCDLQPEPRSRHPVLQRAQASRRHPEQRRIPRASAAPRVDSRWNGRKHGVQQRALDADGSRGPGHLELGDDGPESECERHPLGHPVQHPFRRQHPADAHARHDRLLQDGSADGRQGAGSSRPHLSMSPTGPC